MLRYNIRLTVYKKDELTNKKEIDFPSTPELEDHIRVEIERLLHGVILVDGDNNIYPLGVANIHLST